MQRRRRQYSQSHSPNRRVLAVLYVCHSATAAYFAKYIIKSNVENDPLGGRREGGVFWRPRHWNLLENKCTPLIRAHMRQQPQNVLECACEGASAWFPTNQYLESHSGWPIRSRQRFPYIVQSVALELTSLVGLPRRASPAGPASLPSRCP